jgi:predicted type IV restriction endonuclease
MVQSIAAKEVTLAQLRETFGLQVVRDSNFFTEWMQPSVALTPEEQQMLDRVKQNFESLMEDPPMLENTVKMVVLSPLLDLAGFYRSPYSIETEPSIELTATDGDTIVRGRIDVLVLQQRLWLLVIESKRSDFSVTRGLPQALSYMLANPTKESPSFGLIMNGNEFLFVKAIAHPTSQYATSRLFSLINPGNELYDILKIVKTL